LYHIHPSTPFPHIFSASASTNPSQTVPILSSCSLIL
jgi:hypothetical protein